MVAHRSAQLTPRAAVCIPAHGGDGPLRRVLRSVLAADYPADRRRVVVAIDGPDAALAAAARDAGADRVVVLDRNRGSYAARNAALDAIGDAEIVLFTDTDAEVASGWIRAHARALERAPRSGGRVDMVVTGPVTPAAFVDMRRHLGQRHYVEQLGYAATVNLAVRREVVDAIRFDDRLRSGGDFEFGTRAGAAGFAIVYTPDAVVRHDARSTARDVIRKVDRVARGARDLADSGHHVRARRVDRPRLADDARARGIPATPAWLARAWLVDTGCRLTFARHNPEVVLPALRRRLAP